MALNRLSRTVVRAIVWTATSALLHVQGAIAQSTNTPARTQGLMMDAHVNSTSMSGDFYDTGESYIRSKRTSGVGGGFAAGWGFSKWFSLYAAVDRAAIDVEGASYCNLCDPLPGVDPHAPARRKYTTWNHDLGAQFNWPISTTSFVPYARAAYTYRIAKTTSSDDQSLTGNAVTTGLGLQYFFNTHIAVDAGLQFTNGTFTKLQRDRSTITLTKDRGNNSDNNAARVSVGLRYYPHIGVK